MCNCNTVKKIIVITFIVMLLAAAYRSWQLFPSTSGGGLCSESPDKQFMANAFSMTDRYFFGGERCYYKFTVETKSYQRVRQIIMDAPSEGMIDWRGEEGTIQWAADSSTVTYTFKGTQLTLSVKP